MDNQEDPPVWENPLEAPLAKPIVPPTQMMMQSQLPTPPPMSLRGILAENWTFLRESWESYKITTELDKKPKPVVLETLKIVLGRETYQIAKNLPIADCTDPDSFLQAWRSISNHRTILFLSVTCSNLKEMKILINTWTDCES